MTINHQIILNETKDYIFITLGLILYSFGFTFFLMPYEIVTGGVAGIAAIVYYATSFPNSYTYFLVNAALLVIGLKILGWKFLIKTIYAILMLTILLELMRNAVPLDENGQFVKILGEGQDFMSLVIGCIMTGSALGIVFLNNGSTG
ncbi:MAG: YitT family protein, partial [Prevotella sp.]|nr:YitT family protein [Prevotella sp.]